MAKVAFGAIRDGRIIVMLDDVDCSGCVSFNFHLDKSASNSICVSRNWPDDFKRASGSSEWIADIGEASEFAPFSGLRCSNEQGGVLPVGKGFALHSLFAFSEKDFRSHFFRIKDRSRDPETQVFACRQILQYYHLNIEHRAVVAVIFGYRSLDGGEEGTLEEARRHLEEQLLLLRGRRSTDYHRTDSNHLWISVSMVLWMINLALGRWGDLEESLARSEEFIRNLVSPIGLMAYNANRILLFRAYYAILQGKTSSAADTLQLSFEFYTKCCARAKPDAVTFGEMRDAHDAVHLGLLCLERIKERRKPLEAEIIFSAVNRVRSEAGTALLWNRFKQLRRRLRIQRRKAASL